MSQIEVERFLGRLITDTEFRSKAALSLISMCNSEGILLSVEEISFLRHLDFSLFNSITQTLDDSIRRS